MKKKLIIALSLTLAIGFGGTVYAASSNDIDSTGKTMYEIAEEHVDSINTENSSSTPTSTSHDKAISHGKSCNKKSCLHSILNS